MPFLAPRRVGSARGTGRGAHRRGRARRDRRAPGRIAARRRDRHRDPLRRERADGRRRLPRLPRRPGRPAPVRGARNLLNAPVRHVGSRKRARPHRDADLAAAEARPRARGRLRRGARARSATTSSITSRPRASPTRPPRASAPPSSCARSSATTRARGSSCSCAGPAAGRLDVESLAVLAEVGRISRALADTRFVGHVFNPLADRQAAAALVERDGDSLVIAAALSTQDIESDGGEAAEEALRRIGESPLDIGLGGFGVSFNEVNDETRKDLTRAELIAFPILTILLLVVFRGARRGRDPAAAGHLLDPRHVPRAARDVGVRRHVAVRAQPRDRAEPRPRRRLRVAARLALPRGARARRRADGGGASADGDDGGPDRPVLGLHGRDGARGADAHAAALPVLDRRRGSRRRTALGPDRDPRRAGGARAARHAHQRVRDPPRPGGVRSLQPLVSPGAGRDAAPDRRRARLHGAAARGLVAAAVDDADRAERGRRAAERAVLRRQRVHRRELLTRRDVPGHRQRARRREPRRAGGPARPDRGARRHRRRWALPAPVATRRVRDLHAQRRRPRRARPGRGPGDPRRRPAGQRDHGVRQHGALHRREGEPDRAPAARRLDHRGDHAAAALPSDRLGDPADQDADPERADARRVARRDRARLRGGVARRPVRVHRPAGDRGDEPGLPVRAHLRARDRLRGARDGAHQGAARPRGWTTRRRSRSGSARPGA